LDVAATRLRAETSVAVEMLIADCTASNRLKIVEHRLPEDEQVGVLVSNAEASLSGG
jgi:short-subunit dehydrogenase